MTGKKKALSRLIGADSQLDPLSSLTCFLFV